MSHFHRYSVILANLSEKNINEGGEHCRPCLWSGRHGFLLPESLAKAIACTSWRRAWPQSDSHAEIASSLSLPGPCLLSSACFAIGEQEFYTSTMCGEMNEIYGGNIRVQPCQHR
jgi:hypothetical protein